MEKQAPHYLSFQLWNRKMDEKANVITQHRPATAKNIYNDPATWFSTSQFLMDQMPDTHHR
jgi:hypothetical protein